MSNRNNGTSHYEGALLEDINGKLDAILEGQAAMAEIPPRVARLEIDVSSVKTDIKAIKFAVKDLSTDFKTMNRRLTRLEVASPR